MVDDQVEQRAEIVARLVQIKRGPAGATRGIDVREVQLLVGRADGGEQVEGGVVDLVGIGVGAVDLVDAQDRTQAHLQGLGQHEFGLGHDALFGIDQQDAAVHHAEDALDLAAEVGVAGRVDDVDPGLARLAVPQHARAFGQDGDAAFALLVVGVHGALGRRLIGSEHTRLGQKLVHQGGLAVVDVGDDGDVAQIHLTIRRARRPARLRLWGGRWVQATVRGARASYRCARGNASARTRTGITASLSRRKRASGWRPDGPVRLRSLVVLTRSNSRDFDEEATQDRGRSVGGLTHESGRLVALYATGAS